MVRELAAAGRRNGFSAGIAYICIVKKLLTICFAILYTLITSGFSVNAHYCMGELASVDLHDRSQEPCPKCGMPLKGDCCKDEAKFFKMDDSHQAAKAFAGITASWTAVPVAIQPEWLQPVLNAPVSNRWTPVYAPPPLAAIPLYKQHCIFLV